MRSGREDEDEDEEEEERQGGEYRASISLVLYRP